MGCILCLKKGANMNLIYRRAAKWVIVLMLTFGSISLAGSESEKVDASWPEFPVRIYASLQFATDDFEDFIYEAFSSWSGIPNTRIRLVYEGEMAATITCEAAGCHNGKDLINMIAVSVSEDVGGSIQGKTFLRCAGEAQIDDGCAQAVGSAATLVEADIVIEGNHFEYYYDNDYDQYNEDLRRTLLHLVGRALGFVPPADDGTHTDRKNPDCDFQSVMYTDLCHSSTLTDYDTDMARVKYPTPQED
jgi:hypothetical protein